MKRALVTAVLALVACGGAPPPAQPIVAPKPQEPAVNAPREETLARAFVADLAAGKLAEAEAAEAAIMKEKLPAAALGAVWKGIVDAAGAFKIVEKVELREAKEGFRPVALTCAFERGRRELRVTIDGDGKVAGFFKALVDADVEGDARAVVEAIGKRDVDAISRRLEDRTAQILTPALLKKTLDDVGNGAGALVGIESLRLQKDRGLTTAIAAVRFERAGATVKVTYDPDQRVVGLLLLPPESAADWSAPPYVKADAFEERDVVVGEAKLPGKLTLPKGAGPFPVAVLVHGSGPGDADETIGPNKPFKDLAWGLASRGVASLRYVKRTRHAPAPVATVKDEVIDDVRAAVDEVVHGASIDPKRVIVVGHSLGGYLAPRIAKEIPTVAGIVVLSGPSRPMQDLVVEQLTYIGSLGGPNGDAAAKLVPAARELKKRADDPALKPTDQLDFPGGPKIPGSYFLDLRGYQPAKVAASLKKPVFVVQGGRDYQVTAPDLAGWKAALPASAIHVYPALDHLLRPGEGKSTPESYAVAGHVDEKVVTDLAAWMAAPR